MSDPDGSLGRIVADRAPVRSGDRQLVLAEAEAVLQIHLGIIDRESGFRPGLEEALRVLGHYRSLCADETTPAHLARMRAVCAQEGVLRIDCSRSRISMFLFTFADGVTAAGVGTSPREAEAWLRGLARRPYDAMQIVDCEDYEHMTAARKAAVAARHAPRIYAAACPQCRAVHKCEPWATEVCATCRKAQDKGEGSR